jgi:hypothetical protein
MIRRIRRNRRQSLWFAGTGATAAAVFLITFFAVSAATDDDGGAPTASLAAVTLPGSEAPSVPEVVAAASETQAEPEPAVSEQPAQEPVNDAEEEPTATEQPEVVEDEPGPPLVPLPEFDETDLIHGGTGNRGAILAGHGIVSSSGPTAQTDWVLLVPSARIKASIVRVGLAPGNAFGAPDNPEVIGWWESGPAPGQVGNVLLDGHRDYSDLDDNLGTGVCWALPNTGVGDAILIRDDAASVYYVYEVIETVAVPWNDADAVSYLQSTDDARLTLITCEGSFDTDASNYSKRRIVVAVLMGVAEFGA